MGLCVLVQIEAEHSFVKEEVGLLEDVSFLDIESLCRANFPLRLSVVLDCAFARLLQGRKAAIVKA
jgi:hypothetical protein